MIKIEVTDPRVHSVAELQGLAQMFTILADSKKDAGVRLSDMVAAAREAGAIVSLDVEDVPPPLPAEVEDLVKEAQGITAAMLAELPATTRLADLVAAAQSDAQPPAEELERDARIAVAVAEARAEGATGTLVFPMEGGGQYVDEAPKPDTPALDAPPPVPVDVPDAPPPVPPSTDVAPVAVDRAGLPWDMRIHASSKSINQTDGLWRAKRGVDPELVAEVTAQLKGLMAIPAPPAPPAPVTGAPATFLELMPLVTAARMAGTLTAEEFVEAWKSVGLTSPMELNTRPEFVPSVYAMLEGKL